MQLLPSGGGKLNVSQQQKLSCGKVIVTYCKKANTPAVKNKKSLHKIIFMTLLDSIALAKLSAAKYLPGAL